MIRATSPGVLPLCLCLFLAWAALAVTGQAQATPSFTLTIRPDQLAVNPGKAGAFLVSVSPVGGFAGTVTLDALDLPAGLTASFSPESVTPPATTLLNVAAAADAPVGSASFNIRGTSGDLTVTTATGPVTVDFGLIPISYGTVKGTVTDAETGQPLAGVSVARASSGYTTTTDSQGRFSMTMPVGNDGYDAPLKIVIQAFAQGYLWTGAEVYVVRDQETVVNLAMTPARTGVVVGTVTDAQDAPLPNARVWYDTGYLDYVLTDANGAYVSSAIPLGPANQPVARTFKADKDGYWSASKSIQVSAGTNGPVTFVILPMCKVVVRGSLVYQDTGTPYTDPVHVYTTDTLGSFRSSESDASGRFEFAELPLGMNNAPVAYILRAAIRGDVVVSGGASLTRATTGFPRW